MIGVYDDVNGFSSIWDSPPVDRRALLNQIGLAVNLDFIQGGLR